MRKSTRITLPTCLGGIFAGAGLILTGVCLQIAIGRVEWDLLAAPLNVIVLVLSLGLIVAAHCLRHRVYLFSWLGSLPSAVCSIAWASALTVVMGLVRQRPSSAPQEDFPWLDQMLSNWSFVLIYVWLTVSLGLTVLRVCIPLKPSKIPFLLNHLGLFIAITCGVLGSADLQRLKMTAVAGTPEWRATDDRGRIHELPLAVELKSFRIDEYPPKLMLVDNESGQTLPAGSPQNLLLEEGFTQGQLCDWSVEILQLLEDSAPVFGSDSLRYNAFHSSGSCAAALVRATRTGAGALARTDAHTGDNPDAVSGAGSVEGWVSCGSYTFPVKALKLDENHSLVMPEREPRRYVSEVRIHTPNGVNRADTIQVNHPCRVEGWKIYQYSYDRDRGRWSQYSVFEIIRDPWLPAVYVGIIMLLAGAVCMFVQSLGGFLCARRRCKWILGFSLVMLLVVFTCVTIFKTEILDKTLMPALQSPWFAPHVTVYMFAYALLGASAVMAVYLLWFKRTAVRKDDMALCDKLVCTGLAFMTIGMLFGALWAEQAWGHYWAWDPKETWAAATWFSYLVYIHLRRGGEDGRPVRICLAVLLISIILLQMCWWGINFLPSAQGTSIHVYNQ